MEKFTLLKTITLAGSVLITSATIAQEDVAKFEKVYYEEQTLTKDNYTLDFVNGVATIEYNKLGVKINNNSSDYMMIKREESVFKFPTGDVKPSGEGVTFIRPNSGKTKTLEAKGGTLKVSEFSLDFSGLYMIPLGNAIEAENFKLPPATNSMKIGPFDVKVEKWGATTKEAKVVFECTYNGDKVGIVDESKLSVMAKTKSGEEVSYANDVKKGGADAMTKGDKVKITAIFHIPGKIVDMQFATMYVIWNDVFTESTPELLPTESVKFKMNEPLTREKN